MDEQNPSPEQSALSPQPAQFPFPTILPFIWGGAYGLILRLLFSEHVLVGMKLPGAMTTAFAVVVPIAIGAITVYMAEKKARRSFLVYIFAPWLSVTLFVAGTAIALIEGSICIAMAMPLFLLLGSVGGLVMGVVCRFRNNPIRTVQSIAILPFLFALHEGSHPLPESTHTIIRSVHIASTPEVVWRNVASPTNIKPSELKGGLAYAIGVPYPVEAHLLAPGLGGIRHSVWQHGVSFDERITSWDEKHHMTWQYSFYANSFPPGSMDDHVVIGGEYFDLNETTYTFTPETGGTRLDIAITYRVSTGFNWYAIPMAKIFITSTADALLNLYKTRAESP